MADEILKRDKNHNPVAGGVTNDVNLELRQLRIDPITGGVLTVNALPSNDVSIVDGANQLAINAAGEASVNLPAAQIATLTPPAAITNYANETGGNLAAIKAKTDNIPSQGQALAAASMPVVLPAAQISTLTPPAAITNFALETGGNLAGINAKLVSGTDIGDVTINNTIGAGAVPIQDGGNQITVDGSLSIFGNVLHDTADPDNVTGPVKIGMKAVNMGASPTAVSAGDRTNNYANVHGIPFVLGGHPNTKTFKASYNTAQTNTAIITATAGQKIVVTEIHATVGADMSISSAGFTIGFGATTTPTGDGVLLSHAGVAPGAGDARGTGEGILGVGADGEDVRIDCEATTGDYLTITISYFIIES